MALSNTTLPPRSQWNPSNISLSLRLSKESLKKEVPFFSLIKMEKGFTIPSSSTSSTTFTITEVSEGIITVQISIRNFCNRERDHIAFFTSSELQDVSTTCSKLNMADALKCKITAIMIGKDKVSFSILPPSEAVEKKLLRFFSIYED